MEYRLFDEDWLRCGGLGRPLPGDFEFVDSGRQFPARLGFPFEALLEFAKAAVENRAACDHHDQ